ncbi:MAG: hypothetical protein H7067_10560, partial [Burkholderiales bacterium]|nr:hypothetical protein [Opitutaceae bacterium]
MSTLALRPAHAPVRSRLVRHAASSLVLLAALSVSAARAATLVSWNAPLQTAAPGVFTTPAPTVADGVASTAMAMVNQGTLSPVGPSTTAWRFGNWSNNPTAYLGFSITADADTRLVIDNFFITASLETTSGASWTNATLALSYSPTANFSSGVTSAGSLALGSIGASSTTSFTSSVAGTYFSTPLTIEGGETYYFKLNPTGYSGFNARLWLRADGTSDITVSGTASAIPEPSAAAALAGLLGLGCVLTRR